MDTAEALPANIFAILNMSIFHLSASISNRSGCSTAQGTYLVGCTFYLPNISIGGCVVERFLLAPLFLR